MLFMEADNMSVKSWYRKNYTPEQIKEIQRTLGVEEDGLIGPDTINAIKEYQSDAGLKADGLWGKSTQAKADEWNEQYNSFVPNRSASNDTDNLKEEAYKQYSDNLDKRYWLEEQNKYERNFSPNYEMSNVELAYLNKEIDKVKKQLEDRQAKYESVPQPKTQVGWSSYIVNNDRGMLDKYQDAERAWYNKLKDQEHAKELANAQMEQQAAYRMDDNMKNRSLALNKLQYAKAALNNDTSNNPLIKAGLERDVRNAEEELKYWDKAIGIKYEEDNNTPPNKDNEGESNNPTVDVKDDSTTEVKIEDYSSITNIKNQADKDAILKEMEANPAIKNNKAFKEQYNRIKAITPEDKKSSDKSNRKAKWEEGRKLKGFDYRAWKESPEGKALIKEFGE